MDKRNNAARWTAGLLGLSVAVAIGLLELGVPYEPLSLWIVGIGAPALTLFVLIYGFTARWSQHWIGRALMVSSTGTAALIDVALLNRVVTLPTWFIEPLLLAVLVFMSAGGVLKLLALLIDKVPIWRRKWRHGRAK